MTACDRFDALLLDAVSGELEGDPRAELDAHMAGCPPCLALFKSYLRTTAMAAAAYPDADEPTTPLSDAFVQSVLSYVRGAAGSSGAAAGVA